MEIYLHPRSVYKRRRCKRVYFFLVIFGLLHQIGPISVTFDARLCLALQSEFKFIRLHRGELVFSTRRACLMKKEVRYSTMRTLVPLYDVFLFK